MNRQRHRLPVGLFAHQTLNVNNVFESVHGHDLAFTAFVGAARDQDLVVFADGDRSDLAGGLARISRVGRTWAEDCGGVREAWLLHTLCLSRNSLLRGALMITRRTLEGALKCAFRDFLREEWRAGVGFVY